MDTQIIAQELANIAAQRDGQLLPAAVVDAARDPASPLHTYFDWDDDSAGEKYRLVQAGMLIRRVKVHLVRPSTEGVQIVNVRAYHSLPEDRVDAGGYTPIEVIMSDEDKTFSLCQQALADLRALQRKYENLIEFEGVWRAVAKVRIALARKSSPAPQAEASP